jgi:MFS family permease
MLMTIIMIVALVHIPQMALTPGIARMSTDAFPQFSPLSIQSAVTLPCLLSVLSGVLGAFLIRYGKLTKKLAVIIGLACHGSAGLFVILLHGEFWQIVVAGLLLGSGTGLIVPNITSIMIDDFDGKSQKLATGLQGSFVATGGIIQSFFAGLLVTLVWYGGYIMLLLAWPIFLICLLGLPKERAFKAGSAGKFKEMPRDVYYFSFYASLLFVMTYAALGNNLSLHLQQSGFENYSSLAGAGIAVNLLGGVAMGFFFGKLSHKFGDYLIVIAFFLMALGYFIVATCGESIPLILTGCFINGMSLTSCSPQGIVAIARYTTPRNSFFATLLFNCITNGLAGFLSAIVYTGISQWISGDSTIGRYVFIGVCAIGIGLIFALTTTLRRRRGVQWR